MARANAPVTALALLALGTATVWAQPADPAAVGNQLDFAVYRDTVEPIFLKMRDGIGPGGPCFICHAKITSRFRLQRVPDTLTWSEEASRRNFDVVSRLVEPGAPTQSRLLLHPLAPAAGGDGIHAGGYPWQSQDDPEWQAIAAWIGSTPAGTSIAAPATDNESLDFTSFRAVVEPLFLSKKEGLARCYVCHSRSTNFRLQRLDAGQSGWTEAQSRRNFLAVQRVVVPGDPESSRMLKMPMAPSAGGDPFHPGGRRWASRDDPEWQALAAWVRGEP